MALIKRKKRTVALAVLLIKIAGVLFATKVFASFTPLVDSELYLQNAFWNSKEYRNLITSWVASYLNSHIGPFLTHLVFGFFSVVGLLIRLKSGGSILGLIPFLFLPSSLVWNSVVGKEAIFTAFFVTALVIWANYITRRLTKAEVFMAFVCFIFCAFFRPHYAIVLPWMFLSLFVVKNVHFGTFSIILCAFSLLVCAVYTLFWDDLMIKGFTMIESGARSSRHESLGMILADDELASKHNLLVFTDAIPIGAIFGILGPLPEEVLNRMLLVPFAIEGIIIFLLPLIIYFFSVNLLDSKEKTYIFKKIFWCCIVPGIALLIWLHAPFGVLNPGSAIRWRTNFETLFYFAPMLLFLEINGKKS